MSRADAGAVAAEAPGRHDGVDEDPPARRPLMHSSLPGALRVAATDFYYHSVRLVAANVAWGAILLLLILVASVFGWLPALALSPLLGLPLVGVYRIAGHITRGEEVVLADAPRGMRERVFPALVLADVVAWGAVLLAINVRLGLDSPSVLGWAFATLAGWGLIALLGFALTAWPIAGDPARREMSTREVFRLAAYVVLARPGRMLGLLVVYAVLAGISTIAFAAILTISVAYLALVSCRVVLPEADRLAERLAARDRTRGEDG